MFIRTKVFADNNLSVSQGNLSLPSVNHFLIDASIRYSGAGAKRIYLDAKGPSPSGVWNIVFRTR